MIKVFENPLCDKPMLIDCRVISTSASVNQVQPLSTAFLDVSTIKGSTVIHDTTYTTQVLDSSSKLGIESSSSPPVSPSLSNTQPNSSPTTAAQLK